MAANPSEVRDGSHDVAGSPGGASAFTVNPPGGPAGFTGMIQRVLDYALSDQAQAGVAQAAPSGSGLGPSGDQSLGYTPATDLAGFAGGLVGAMSQATGAVTTSLTAAQSLQSGLQSRLSSTDGVSIDTEMANMIQLQNDYGANAKVITAVQTMYTALMAMVP